MRVGIIGGGQLARMLADAGGTLGLDVVVFAEVRHEPACLVAPCVTGSMNDEEALAAFFADLDVVIFENEFVDTAALARAARDRASSLFRPSLETLRTLQDKTGQKRVLARVNAPHPRWFAQENREAADAFFDRARDAFAGRAVLKWARLGYDGKGVLRIEAERDRATAREFLARAVGAGVEVFAEELVDFRRELAIVATRGANDDFIAYPLVISEQERSICRLVHGPAVSEGVPLRLEEEARAIAYAIGEEAKLVGTFAIEFFETDDERLLVNEIAPRVHNSGHYTMDACATSQFENHWRGALDLPLGEPDCRAAFAMWNLLGPDGVTRSDDASTKPLDAGRARVHWYEKSQIVPWRKLGHVNGVAEDASELPRLIAELREVDARWRERLANETNGGAA